MYGSSKMTSDPILQVVDLSGKLLKVNIDQVKPYFISYCSTNFKIHNIGNLNKNVMLKKQQKRKN